MSSFSKDVDTTRKNNEFFCKGVTGNCSRMLCKRDYWVLIYMVRIFLETHYCESLRVNAEEARATSTSSL